MIHGKEQQASVLVSVWMITFNHAVYIERAIRSVLAQRGTFEIELVIGDDASTDGTSEICQSLAREFSRTINYERNERNIGMEENVVRTYQRCRGKYVAMLEGDDEWIDDRKLSKQIEMLESDPHAAMCYANAQIRDTRNPRSVIYFSPEAPPPGRIDKYAAIEHCVVPTCTVVFRNVGVEIPEWFVRARDSAYFLYYLLCRNGDMVYLNETVGLYNQHYEGMSRKRNVNEMLFADGLLSYRLVGYYNGDPRIRDVVTRKHTLAVDKLFHRGAFLQAIRLFWRLPLYQLFRHSQTRPALLKQLTKIHFLFFLSQRLEKRAG